MLWYFINSFVCLQQWYNVFSLIMMKGSCIKVWSLDYITLIYLYKYHYLFLLNKSEDWFPNKRLLSNVYLYVWFHYRDILALVWSNPFTVLNKDIQRKCFICKNKINLFSMFIIFNSILFFCYRSLKLIFIKFKCSYLLNEKKFKHLQITLQFNFNFYMYKYFVE